MEKIVDFLKSLIDAKGPDYIWNNPYDVYTESLETGIENQDARILLFVLLNGIELRDFVVNASGNVSSVSQELRRRCLLQKTVTDRFASLLVSLFSDENLAWWESARESGFKKFCKRKWIFEWEGEARWESSGGYVDSECSATATVKVVDKKKAYAAVEGILKKNPFATEDDLFEFFEEKYNDVLDEDFFHYCTCDGYYPPVAEEYYDNYSGEVESFCMKYGFKLLDYTCDGSSGSYEPYDYYDRY